jgi:hypothetical protein
MPTMIAVTDTAGRRSHTATPARSQAIEFGTGQATPMDGSCQKATWGGT